MRSLLVIAMLALVGCAGPLLTATQAEHLRSHNLKAYGDTISGDSLTIADLIALSQANVPDPVIKELILRSHTAYVISAQTVQELRDTGMSEALIEWIDETGWPYEHFPKVPMRVEK